MSHRFQAGQQTAYDRRVMYVVCCLQSEPQLRAVKLAPMVNLSTSHLERLFKKQLGITIGKYSLELRLQLARKFLRETFWSVKEIRQEIGIQDASNFTHQFKKRFGTTPTAYRKQLNAHLDQ